MVVVEKFGDWMMSRRKALGYVTRKDFVRGTGLSDTLVWELETGKNKPYHERALSTRFVVAGALKVAPTYLEKFSRDGTVPPEQTTTIMSNGFSNNLARIGVVPLRSLEHHHGLPASRFVEAEAGQAHIRIPASDDHSFTATIVGECMWPDYPDGWLVVFSVERAGLEGLQEGADYYVQQNGEGDGTHTFKRLLVVSKDTLTFGCINVEKFPQQIIVPRRHIERIARSTLVARRT